MNEDKPSSGQGWSFIPATPAQPVTAKFRLEKRMGKAVTVVFGLESYGSEKLNAIARELKTAFGTGGTVKDGKIEIQGDRIADTKEWFRKK